MIFIFLVACGGLFTGDKGEISTPNYPSKYPSNSDCIWVIRPRTFSPIELKFTGFSIEPESRCGYDYVEVITSFIFLIFENASINFNNTLLPSHGQQNFIHSHEAHCVLLFADITWSTGTHDITL